MKHMGRCIDRRLDSSTRRSLLQLVDSASRTPSTQDRLLLVVDGVTDLMDGEVGGFNYVDSVEDRAIVVMRPQVVPDPVGDLQREYRQHPVVIHYQRTQLPEPQLLTRCSMGRWARWRDHPTYSALFKPMGTPYEIVIPVSWPGDRPAYSSASYAVTRSTVDFSEREIGIGLAVQQLIKTLHDGDPALLPAGRIALLTAAEHNVLLLYSLRLTEAQVAEHRGSSRETVRTQLRIGCRKLGVSGPSRRRVLASAFGFVAPAPLPVDRLAHILDS